MHCMETSSGHSLQKGDQDDPEVNDIKQGIGNGTTDWRERSVRL